MPLATFDLREHVLFLVSNFGKAAGRGRHRLDDLNSLGGSSGGGVVGGNECCQASPQFE